MPTCGGCPTGSCHTASGANSDSTCVLSLAFDALTYWSTTARTVSGLFDDDAIQVLAWFRDLRVHVLECVQQQRRNGRAGDPLVISGNDVPRRVLRGRRGDR